MVMYLEEYIFCIPVEGDPYRLATLQKINYPRIYEYTEAELKLSKEANNDYNIKFNDIVKPIISTKENIPDKYYKMANLKLNYTFQESKKGWVLRMMLQQYSPLLYVEENGFDKCCPNNNTYIENYFARPLGSPHLFGDIIMVVPKDKFVNFIASNKYKVTIEDYDKKVIDTDIDSFVKEDCKNKLLETYVSKFEEKIAIIREKYNDKSKNYIVKKATGAYGENKEWGLLKMKELSELRQICLEELENSYDYNYHQKCIKEVNEKRKRWVESYGRRPENIMLKRTGAYQESRVPHKSQAYCCRSYEKVRIFYETILVQEYNDADRCINYHYNIPNWKPHLEGFYIDMYDKSYNKATLDYAFHSVDLSLGKNKTI